MVELKVPVALLGYCTRVEEQHSVKIESEPIRSLRLGVVLNDVEC